MPSMMISQQDRDRGIRRRKGQRASVPRRRGFRPRLEGLENRAVLSTLTVINNHDSGAGSLRAAIQAARSGDTIVFAPSLNGQTITLTSDQLAISKSLDIEGPGAGLLAISGGDVNRVFDISEGNTVTIAGLTITHGRANASITDNGGSGGGGILNGGTLTVANDVFSDNRSETHGGAIVDGPHSILTVRGSLFTDNEAAAKKVFDHVEGGAIWNGKDGCTATIIGSTFIGNRSIGGDGGVSDFVGEANGGALHNDGTSTLTVLGSTFIANQAIGGNGGSGGNWSGVVIVDVGDGGAIVNDSTGTLVVDGCTFTGNQAIGGSGDTGSTSGQNRIGHAIGGAIATEGVATITNSTFDRNEALGGSNNTGFSGDLIVGRGVGGAIANFIFVHKGHPSQAALTIGNCTFTGNQAVGGTGNTGGPYAGDGIGGAFDNERGGTATVTGSTFTGNQALGGQRVGGNGADGLGGGIANLFGATLTVSGCTLSGNQALGGAGGSGANGGNGFGGGLFNDGLSLAPFNAGTPAILTVLGSTISGNRAVGGTAGAGGAIGLGIGGGLYLTDGGIVCLDVFTSVIGNTASTSHHNVFGVFTICS
jgi:hypothetical protein